MSATTPAGGRARGRERGDLVRRDPPRRRVSAPRPVSDSAGAPRSCSDPARKAPAASRRLESGWRGSSGNHDHRANARAALGGQDSAAGLGLAADARGVYAPFFAVIASVLLLLGAIAYDGPRLTAARQDALHAANEAARVAAATIASGGTTDDARTAAEERMTKSRLIYNRPIAVGAIECAGSRVQVTVVSSYIYRSALGLIRDVQPIEATGAAEAYLVLPDDTPSELKYLGECPL